MRNVLLLDMQLIRGRVQNVLYDGNRQADGQQKIRLYFSWCARPLARENVNYTTE